MLHLIASLTLSSPAFALDLAGATVPDTATLVEQTLHLVGAGEARQGDITLYVAALYLPRPIATASQTIREEVPKRITLHFTYPKLSSAQLNGMFSEGLVATGGGDATVKAGFEQLFGALNGARAGDVLTFEYIPQKEHTVVRMNEAVVTRVEGKAFMKAFWGLYLSDKVKDKRLKAGMLGN